MGTFTDCSQNLFNYIARRYSNRSVRSVNKFCNPAKSCNPVYDLLSTAYANLIQVSQQIRRIVINPISAGAFKLFTTVTT